MLCPRCASQIPDDARVCPHCRTVLTVDSPTLAATDVARDLPQQEKRIRFILIAIVLTGTLGWLAWNIANRYGNSMRAAGQAHSIQLESHPVVSAPFALKPRVPVSFAFAVPSGCTSVNLESRFEPGLDPGNNAPQVTVFDETSFAAWKKHQPSRAIYTGKVREGTVEVTLPSAPRRYFLVFTSGASPLPKTLQGDVRLNCYRSRP